MDMEYGQYSAETIEDTEKVATNHLSTVIPES